MWKALRSYGAGSAGVGNAHLRALARKGSEHLFEDIGLSRAAFVDSIEEHLRHRHWWYQ